METATKVNITISVDAHEFVSAVLGSSFTTSAFPHKLITSSAKVAQPYHQPPL